LLRFGLPEGRLLHGAAIDSGGDHRIAMAFSVAACAPKGKALIQGADSTAISFPASFDLPDQVRRTLSRLSPLRCSFVMDPL
jgi:3-phosphoshikimate 1-carboxyvinyltransferase